MLYHKSVIYFFFRTEEAAKYLKETKQFTDEFTVMEELMGSVIL